MKSHQPRDARSYTTGTAPVAVWAHVGSIWVGFRPLGSIMGLYSGHISPVLQVTHFLCHFLAKRDHF